MSSGRRSWSRKNPLLHSSRHPCRELAVELEEVVEEVTMLEGVVVPDVDVGMAAALDVVVIKASPSVNTARSRGTSGSIAALDLRDGDLPTLSRSSHPTAMPLHLPKP